MDCGPLSSTKVAEPTLVAAAKSAAVGVAVRSIFASLTLLTRSSTAEASARVGFGLVICQSPPEFLLNSIGAPFAANVTEVILSELRVRRRLSRRSLTVLSKDDLFGEATV